MRGEAPESRPFRSKKQGIFVERQDRRETKQTTEDRKEEIMGIRWGEKMILTREKRLCLGRHQKDEGKKKGRPKRLRCRGLN